MADNSSWWLLLPCGIVTLSLTIVITAIVTVFRRAVRPAMNIRRNPGQFGTTTSYSGSPLDPNWTPDQNPAAPPPHDSGHSSHHHWESHGHTIHHHDSGSSSSSDSGSSSWGDSGSSHHHHSD
ncbi:hypothetical protein [Dactylosporangium sp. CA-139066]|uniref:hypothetical protein n=1 Tax=Dactylosporangium sp. CA-139066 TaxID=3239930 RepID=UPI003D8AD70E